MGSKRLDWIDIAKGIAIILVIVGHTVPNPSPLRHAITTYGTSRRDTEPLSSSRHGFGLNVYPARIKNTGI